MIQDMAEQLQSLERKISRIYQRNIDIDVNVQLEENEINTFTKESVETEVIHMKDDIVIKENAKHGQLFYCEMCNYKCKIKTTMEKHLHKKHENYEQCELCDRKFMMKCLLNNHMNEDHENEHESSFVFSESMLDEFIDQDKEPVDE